MPTDAPVADAPRSTPSRPWPHVGRATAITIVVLVVLLVAMPWLVSNFWLRVATSALVFAGLALSLNVIMGLAGYPALGNIVFFGVGAYVSGLTAANLDLPPPVAIGAGALGAAAYALVASRAMLSLRGSYFLMATVALDFLTLELVIVLRGITRGARGLTIPPLVTGDPSLVYDTFYFLFLGLVATGAIVILALRRSRLGLGLLAIKGNEDAALMLGVPTFRYKAIAWSLSAALAGAIGATHAYWIGFIDPGSSFDLIMSLEVFLVTLLGGPLLVIGPIIGSFAYEVSGVIAWASFTDAHLAVLGILIVLVVMFLPGGLPELPMRLGELTTRLRGRDGRPA